MKVNKFKSLALALAISAVSSAAFATSATITTIDIPFALSAEIGVSDQGQVSLMRNYGINSPIGTKAYTWSEEDGLNELGQIEEQMHYIDSSVDGSRVALLTGSASTIFYPTQTNDTHIYTDGVQQVISGSVFASFVMSGDGTTLGGTDANQQPAIMDIDTGTITPISIPNVNLSNYAVRLISDNAQTLLVAGSTLAYLVDRAGNVKATIDLTATPGSSTPGGFLAILDISGDGSTLTAQTTAGCTSEYICQYNGWTWTQQSGFQKLIDNATFHPKLNHNASIMTAGTSIWDDVSGSRNLVSALQAKGVDVTGWAGLRVYDISSNGKYLVGSGMKDGVTKAFLIENNAVPQCTVPSF